MNANIKEDIVIPFNSHLPTFIGSIFGSISINENRNLISFGKNEKGFLGHEGIDKIIIAPKQIPNLMNIKMVDCGYKHTVCIDYDGNVFTFGNNDKGQLGIDFELPFTHIPQRITNISPIDSISCGHNFSICITNNRCAYSFGENKLGQLGIGNNDISYSSPQLIPELNDIEFIEIGSNHTICKTYSNEYYSWGHNYFGQLGQGHYNSCNKPHKCENWIDDIIDIKCSEHTLLLTSTGYVYSFGNNDYGQLGLTDSDIKKTVNIPTLIKGIPLIKRIECGLIHSTLIDINDNLWVFGNNAFRQLGLENKKNRYKPILNESLHDIIDISPGGNHTFVKTTNNEIYAFGNNIFSQLGTKTSEKYQLTPIRVFKDNEDIWALSTRRSKQKSARK